MPRLPKTIPHPEIPIKNRINLLEKQVDYLRRRLDEVYYAPNMPGMMRAIEEAQKEVSAPYIQEEEWPQHGTKQTDVPIYGADCTLKLLEAGEEKIKAWGEKNKEKLMCQYSCQKVTFDRLLKDLHFYKKFDGRTKPLRHSYSPYQLQTLRKMVAEICE